MKKFDPTQYSLFVFKPDSMAKSIWGHIMNQLALSGQKPVCGRSLIMTDTEINAHYAAHVGKPFFPRLANFMKSGPSFVMLVYGSQQHCREICEQVREDFAVDNPCNLIHASDSPTEVLREVKLWFPEVLL